jgi:pimeloyl-ACP methyl ester carboxylesterase
VAGSEARLASVRQLYPPIEPFSAEHLKVSDLHDIYVEQSGRPDGQPVLFVHGGPGGGTDAWDLHRRWPEAELEIVPDAGHSAIEIGIADRLIEATDRFATLPSTGR